MEKLNSSKENQTEQYGISQYLYITLEILLACTIYFGNVLVIVAYRRSSYLKTTTNYFILNLACADLIVGLSMPMHIAMFVYPDMLSNEHVCMLRYASLLFPMSTSVLCLAAITYDRYVSLVKSMQYTNYMTKRKVRVTVVFVWIMPLLTCLVVPMLYHNPLPESGPDTCDLLHVLKIEHFGYILLPAITIIIAIIIVMYQRIFTIARRHANQIAVQQLSTNMERRKRVFITSMRMHKTGAIVLGVFLICWLPFLLTTIIQTYSHLKDNARITEARIYFTILAIFNSATNPVIYAWRIRQFRYQFKKILRMRMNNSVEVMECSVSSVGVS